jgi:CRP/FNR family transcriptional regulator, cyclic AMP receptor protein
MSNAMLETASTSNGTVSPSRGQLGRRAATTAVRYGNGVEIERGVRLLDEDRELAAAAPSEHVRALRHLLRVDTLRIPPGEWNLDRPPLEPEGAIGLLVLSGFITRSEGVGTRRSAEPLGPGDLLRPWDHDGRAAPCVATEASWRACDHARVALLDQRVGAVLGRSAGVTVELMSRLVRRSRLLAVLLALTQVRQLQLRVLLVLWTLADRWGHVTPEGTTLTIPLTHATIAQLAGASRPSVTSAVAGLREQGLAAPTINHGWQLMGDPPGGWSQGSTSPRRIA